MAARIDRFAGEYAFLSNFYRQPVTLDGTTYQTPEHAFQALKAALPQDHDYVAAAENSSEAKRRGRSVSMREDWEAVRIDVMRRIVTAKFAPGTQLAHKLELTGYAELVEGNTWGDHFWGVCRNSGMNWLGKILMEVRQKNREAARLAAGTQPVQATA